MRLLVLAPWPKLDGLDDAKAEAEIGWLIDLVTAIRSVRVEMNIPPATPIPVVLAGARPRPRRAPGAGPSSSSGWRASPTSPLPMRAPQGSVQLLIRGEVAALPLKGVIDFAAERARLDKEMQKADADIERVDEKLDNPKFVANARRGDGRGRERKARGGRGPPRQDRRGAGAAEKRAR